MAADAVAAAPVISDTILIGILVVVALVVICLIIREIRLMKTTTRKVELEIERDKLRLLQQHDARTTSLFPRFSPEQLAEIRQVEDENSAVLISISAKERLLETRLARLENLVKEKKVDKLLADAGEQEKKVR